MHAQRRILMTLLSVLTDRDAASDACLAPDHRSQPRP